MNDQDFTTAFTVNQTPEDAFAAIKNVHGWWSEEIEGNADKLGDEFTCHLKDVHRSRQRVTGSIPGRKVVWRVLDSHLDFAQDKSEWKGTDITFDIFRRDDKTEVRFTHLGLVPEIECFDACSDAWDFYINTSLRSLITTGEGQPNGIEKTNRELDGAGAAEGR
jgi:hypothetical protein